ncbi:TlpA disulfide reductase family protein [uncultured Piscinibacter sp.]|uniref:TlpA family protein disulfide reductase n=1 Tax=uncultured Piscinibacter sp. TaxID=1131835 RepID=UPI00261C359E|nr:TlpA disulfide reductase family protein [uncultured Piscinibacter sp.]
MKRRSLLVGSAVGAAAALAGAGVAWWRLRVAEPPLPAGFWDSRFERPEGGELALASLRGKPLVLNFWATWCAPCVTELPLLDGFHREQNPRGWTVVALAIDSPTPVREFLRQRPLAMPVGLAGLDGVEFGRSLGNHQGGLPFTVVLGSDGTVRWRKLGALGTADIEAWQSSVS